MHALNLRLEGFLQDCSSDDRPSSPSIEFEVKRATEDLIRSGSSLGIFFSANLLISGSGSEFRGAESSAAVEDIGAFISFSDIGLITDVNDTASRVNNCL